MDEGINGTLRSLCAPSLQREIKRRFWEQIATGITSESAADAVVVSPVVGTRWFWHRGGKLEYRASVAQWKAELMARRPKPAKLVINPRLHHYVQNRLAGKIQDAEGHEIARPRQAPFKGRNKPHRVDRQ